MEELELELGLAELIEQDSIKSKVAAKRQRKLQEKVDGKVKKVKRTSNKRFNVDEDDEWNDYLRHYR